MSETDQDLTSVVDSTEQHGKGGTEAENIRALRAQRDELRQQNLWFQQQMTALQQNQRHNAPNQVVEEEFDFRSLENEEFPDGKKVSKAFNALDKRLNSYDLKLSEKDRKIAILEAAMQHKDFNDIVTTENIKKYIESDEDNLESVQKANNPGLKIYNLIKKSAAYQSDVQSKKSASQEQAKIDEKELKPKSSSLGVRSEAVSTAAAISNSKMTREQKNALWLETQSAARSSKR